jgi:hypothetical protein
LRRYSVQRQLFRPGTLDGVVAISNRFFKAIPAKAGLFGAPLLKPAQNQ